jgi:chemotaxis protein MotB
MTARRISLGMIASLALILGCQDDANLKMIEELQDQNADLRAQNEDLINRLNSCMSGRENDRSTILSLEQQLRQARNQPTRVIEVPAENSNRLPADWQQTGDGTIKWVNVGSDILFDSGRATLKRAGQNKLSEIASQIRSNFPSDEIWVVGHTDSDPIKVTKNLWQDNLDLSCNRAMTVFRELMKAGLDPRTMYAAGQGEYNPLVSNDSRSNKSQNRRVQILAISKPPTR